MRFRAYGIVLGLFFALGLVFSFGVDAFADHGDGTGKAAGDVAPTNEADVEAFLDHIIEFYNKNYVPSDSPEEQTAKLTTYGRLIREEGIYNNSENGMYSMGISEGKFVTNHGGHSGLYGYRFVEMAQDSEVASTIQELITDSAITVNACDTYGDEGRVACATKVDSPSGIVTVIAGLHHEEDDSAFVFPDCTNFSSIDTPATDVTDKESLKKYVESVIASAQALISKIGSELFAENSELFTKVLANTATPEEQSEVGKLTSQKLFEEVACFSNEDPDNGPVLKHGTIYSFIMNTDAKATVLVNGQNPDLNGLDLQVNDPNPIDRANIAELIRGAVLDSQGNPKAEGAFVEYHWLKPGDDPIDNWFEDKVVPGNSRKISYVKAADLNTSGIGPAAVYIFGSGIYPEDMMPEDMMTGSDDDDDGCAIAGAGHTSQGALLNLFLIASVLFSVVFLRRRV